MPERIIELLYPRRCALCDRPLLSKEILVCKDCGKRLPFLTGPVCFICGQPLDDKTEEYCRGCKDNHHSYLRGYAPFLYKGQVRESILKLKYSHRAEYANFYAKAIYAYGKYLLNSWKPQAIVPIPIHKDRLIHRGYNQAGLIGSELAALLGIPCVEALLRVHSTKPMKELSIIDRKKNLIRAFRVNPQTRLPARILLVDDIYTTGATIDAAAALLLAAGAEQIWYTCAAITPG